MSTRDVTVLRQVALRDVHVRHDLHAGDERGMKLLGRRRLLLQQPVNPVTQLQRHFKRHQMNVARAFPKRGGNDDVDQVDHRRLIGHHLDVVEVLAVGGGTFVVVQILDHLPHRERIAFGNFLQNVRRRRFGFPHLKTAQQPDVIDHPLVAGIRRGDVEGAILNLDGQNLVTPGKIRRQRANGFGGHVKPGDAALTLR